MLKNWYWLIGIASSFSKDPETVEINCSRIFLVIKLTFLFPESILSSKVTKKSFPIFHLSASILFRVVCQRLTAACLCRHL